MVGGVERRGGIRRCHGGFLDQQRPKSPPTERVKILTYSCTTRVVGRKSSVGDTSAAASALERLSSSIIRKSGTEERDLIPGTVQVPYARIIGILLAGLGAAQVTVQS